MTSQGATAISLSAGGPMGSGGDCGKLEDRNLPEGVLLQPVTCRVGVQAQCYQFLKKHQKCGSLVERLEINLNAKHCVGQTKYV